MISDVLYEAEVDITDYLDCELYEGWYGKSGEPLHDAIDNLLEHMREVRRLMGLERPLSETEWDEKMAAVQCRWSRVVSD